MSDIEGILASAASRERSGDLLGAYDALANDVHDDIRIKHRRVLLLARAGASLEARRAFSHLGLDRATDNEEVLSLAARLLKDDALAQGNVTALLAAADAYGRAFDVSQKPYPGINRATLLLLAGNVAAAKQMAEAVLTRLPDDAGADEDRYYARATAAEAHFILGNMQAAATALSAAVAADPDNLAARATTIRQLERICAARGVSSTWLDSYRAPPALHYTGHMFTAARAADFAPDVAQFFERLKPGSAFGGLAAGADIVIAETALAAGTELHVVLPLNADAFISQSVAPFGEAWIPRFHDCLAKASTVRFLTQEPFMNDDVVFGYGAGVAMGLAVQQAQMLCTRAHQLALWDGRASEGAAGTGADVARWKASGRPCHAVAFPDAARRQPQPRPRGRVCKAMLFADVRGFSKLTEPHIRPFVAGILTALAHALKGLPVQPELVATWGDGLHLVFDAATDAAAAAVALQAAFAGVDLAALGLPDHLALRVGGHFGPVAEMTDPLLAARSFYGTHITVAARIEPTALPGAIYVSEAFAAMVAFAGGYRTEYVGQTELPKGFGAIRLFSLQPDPG